MYTVYSKGSSCPFCVKAKQLLNDNNEEVIVILIPDDISRDKLLKIASNANENITDENLTVPQIFKDDEKGSRTYIGGYDELVKYFENKEEESKIDFSQMEI